MVDAAGSPTFVLTVDAVKWAIATLSKRKIHPHFLAYLQVHRRWTYDGQFDPQWSELRPLLEMPGGPRKKPNYRPLWNRDSDGSVFWFNDNLAGSFATSSIRRTAGFLVDGETYVLPEDHAIRALDKLLYGDRAPAVALSVYLFRNFGFRISTGSSPADSGLTMVELDRLRAANPSEFERRRDISPTVIGSLARPTAVDDGWRRGDDSSDLLPEPGDVVTAFRRRFQFNDDEEFESLFDASAPSAGSTWFEPLLEAQVE
ncbi:hypothetical protein C5C36_16210 [Rathayibacter sp. AY1G1]|uniref:hypothetical protein n=1 Tax=Rathayibacter sp. AY1G1 TaxID=2080564 RepID=UPI000CE7208D|nr:hypothetical protein [Rathayibacter sp. AY1G1]PPH08592.1 hypothetical protein C5C36_16210 [Rathayibacter sp. AY1G1]